MLWVAPCLCETIFHLPSMRVSRQLRVHFFVYHFRFHSWIPLYFLCNYKVIFIYYSQKQNNIFKNVSLYVKALCCTDLILLLQYLLSVFLNLLIKFNAQTLIMLKLDAAFLFFLFYLHLLSLLHLIYCVPSQHSSELVYTLITQSFL